MSAGGKAKERHARHNPNKTCDRCTRPALFTIKRSYAMDNNVTGDFCGRHAAKCDMPTVGCTLASAGLGAMGKDTAPVDTVAASIPDPDGTSVTTTPLQ